MKGINLKEAKALFEEKVYNKIDKKFWIYGVFLFFSIVIWFFNELDQNFNTTINYPVRYSNLPEDKYLVNELPKTLKLNVDAYGFTLLRYKLSPSPFPVPIDLNYFRNQMKNANERFVLHTRYVKEDVNREMPSNINVLEILPDTIAFEFVDIIEKKIAIIPSAKMTFDIQCMLEKDIRMKPDSIMVVGPTCILDTLKGITTKKQRFRKLNKTVSKNVSLVEIDDVSFRKQKPEMTVPVAKYTETKTEVPISMVHVPDSLHIITFPSTVSLSYMVSLKHYDKIKAKDFRIEVDYYDIEKLLGTKLPLRLKVSPKSIQKVSYYPTQVEFILEKK